MLHCNHDNLGFFCSHNYDLQTCTRLKYYIRNTCVKCICTADERLDRRKGSRSYMYICNQTVVKNLNGI